MLIEEATYTQCNYSRLEWKDHVFRFCQFEGLSAERVASIESCFLSCSFERDEWYAILFNGAVFVEVTFTDCVFRGCTFAGCKFVDCELTNCNFTNDNLGGSCTFPDTRWYGCKQSGCRGLEGQL